MVRVQRSAPGASPIGCVTEEECAGGEHFAA